LKVKQVNKIYKDGTKALSDVSVTVDQGEFVAVLGPSGAGKSTFLRCINRLVEPTSGQIFLGKVEVTSLSGKRLREVRRQIGMIFQQFNLVRRLSVLQNVLCGRLGYTSTWRSLFYSFPKADIEWALECLERVGLREVAEKRVETLSGGQQQRVAIARALAQRPKIILADEPIASVDPPTAKMIMDFLKTINREENITIIVNLHVVEWAKNYADRVIGLARGKIVFDGPPSSLDEHLESIYRGRETRIVEDVSLTSNRLRLIWKAEAGRIISVRWQVEEEKGGEGVCLGK